MKSLLQVETGTAPQIHPLSTLAQKVTTACLFAGASTSRYVAASVRNVSAAAISGWSETMRYRSPSMAAGEAQRWLEEADALYTDTIANMILDGVIS